MFAKQTSEKLLEYAQEIGIEKLSLDDLIESHRMLRALNLDDATARVKAFNNAREEAYEDAYAYAIHNLYFTAKQLKSMTIGELVEKLKEE
jgi:hypothetical protein